MAGIVCRYWWTEDTTEKKTLVRTEAIPHIIEDHKLFKKIRIQASRHIIINTEGEDETGKPRTVTGHWATITGYLQFNFELKTDKAVSRGVQSVLNFRRHALCFVAYETWDFPDLNINTSKRLFLRLKLTACSRGMRGGLMDSLANRD